MPASYSNFRAFRALTKASLQAIMRSPSAIVFGLAFPLIFILVFGFLSGGRGYSIPVSFAPETDTTSAFAQVVKNIPVLKWKYYKDSAERSQALKDGDVNLISITSNALGQQPAYIVHLRTPSVLMDKGQQLRSALQQAAAGMDPEIGRRANAIASIDIQETVVREYKTIDFILPGQLGFSLLAGSVFGTAFVFFNLRQTLVLKRFFATPVRREIIVLSEGVARMIFQLVTAIVIIGVGHYAFGFTLVHGFVTFVEMLAICILGIMVFMGFGFIVSSIAKNESTIPPFANMITLPQFLLAGTFFSTENFPVWMRPLANNLPLTYFNNAMRQVAFEGGGFGAIQWDLLKLVIWGVVTYVIAAKVFKWE